MTITALPTPPLRSDPTSFASRGDAFLAALPTFAEEANALAAAMNLNSTTDASASGVLIGTGVKTFTVTAGKSFQPGMYLVIADAAAPSANSMWGQITSYSGTSLVVNIIAVRGSGTKTSWVISQSAPGGAAAGENTDITSLSALTSINGGQLAGMRNRITNGGFAVNQRVYVSGTAVGAGLYGHDRWKMAASGDTYTYSTTANKTIITIPAGKVLRQVIEGLNLETGTYCLSWEGTAQGKIGAGAYGASGITGAITGGTNTTIEFGPGTVSNVQLEFGSVATVFEQRPYGLELMLCQRYFYLLSRSNVQVTSDGYLLLKTPCPVVMRANPTITTAYLLTLTSGTARTLPTWITNGLNGEAYAAGYTANETLSIYATSLSAEL